MPRTNVDLCIYSFLQLKLNQSMHGSIEDVDVYVDVHICFFCVISIRSSIRSLQPNAEPIYVCFGIMLC